MKTFSLGYKSCFQPSVVVWFILWTGSQVLATLPRADPYQNAAKMEDKEGVVEMMLLRKVWLNQEGCLFMFVSTKIKIYLLE